MRPGLRSLYSAPIAVLALYGAVQAASLFQHDLQFISSQTEVSFWGRGNYQPTATTLRGTEQNIDKLLYSNPHHPAYLSLAANSYAWQAYWAEDAKTTREFAEKAVQLQIAALQSRPAHLQSQAKLNEYITRLKDTP